MKFFGFLCWIFSTSLWAADSSGLQISGAGNVIGQAGTGSNANASQRLLVQEAEIMIASPVDYLFDARISLAGHADLDNPSAGPYPRFEMHEAWVGSSKIIPRSRFRVGQYFLTIGRLNQFHRHDWPFAIAPIVQSRFFGEEGVLDSGVEYSFLTPLPFYLDITAGVTNGWTFGHVDNTQGAAPLVPTHYFRAVTYFNLPWNGGSQVGLNYLGRTDSTGLRTSIMGADITGKWTSNGKLQFLFQSEIWYQRQQRATLQPTSNWGLYVFPQYYLGSNLFLGVRLDYYSTAWENSDPNPQFDEAVVPTLTWKPSEFMTFRAAYSFMDSLLSNQATQISHRIDLQAVFILGAHPAHDF